MVPASADCVPRGVLIQTAELSLINQPSSTVYVQYLPQPPLKSVPSPAIAQPVTGSALEDGGVA